MRKFLIILLILWAGQAAAFEQYHIYWGDLHGHSALSDGKGTPAEYFNYNHKNAYFPSRLHYLLRAKTPPTIRPVSLLPPSSNTD